MSSATLTEARRRSKKPATAPPLPAEAGADRGTGASGGQWRLFLAAALAVAAVAVVLLRGTAAPALIMVALTVVAAGLTGLGLFHTLAPLVGAGAGDDTPMVDGRTRAALERDKALTLRAIKELEFDRAMGKVADADFADMHERLRARAIRLLRQLEGSGLYRQLIDREVAERLASLPEAPPAAGDCPSCGTGNDADARFCKMCGDALVRGGAA